jgi:very-short-patch-repair endonuclease
MSLETDSFINEFIEKYNDAEFIKFECPRSTFNMIGEQSPIVVDNAAVAAAIAPNTESPIEVIFGAEAFKFFRAKYTKHQSMKFALCKQKEEDRFTTGDYTLLMPQYKWRNFRIDWAVKVTFLQQPYFFIECDGREFHSSEEQQLRDRKKNEAASAVGIPIFRFSGRDIDRNAAACIRLVFLQIKKQFEREWNAGLHRDAL